MPVTLKVKSADPNTKTNHENTARRVLDQFKKEPPDTRLLCFLDDADWQGMKDCLGIANRGAYTHIEKGYPPQWLREAPNHVKDFLIVDGQIAFDDFIYLHGSACTNPVGLAMTLAHELQHFVQHGTTPTLWAANTIVQRLDKSIIAILGLTWCDVPHEREARIVSKRVAKKLFGAPAVSRYIAEKVRENVTRDDVADWQCIRGLDTSAPFDLAAETEKFFPRLMPYKMELDAALRCQNDPAFEKVDLDALLKGETV